MGRPFIEKYGLWGVALGLFTETMLFTGIVMPGLAFLVAAGFLIAAKVLPPGPVLLLAWAGALMGDQASYVLGYFFGNALLRRKKEFADRLRNSLETEGAFLLLWYHYAPALRAILPCVAGSTRYPLRQWIIFDSIGVMLWVVIYILIGFCAHGLLYWQGNLAALIINALATLLTLYVMWRIYLNLRKYKIIKERNRGENGK